MIRYALGFVFLAMTTLALAECDVEQRGIGRQKSSGQDLFSPSFSNGFSVNIPLKIDGKQACYRQSSSIKVKTEKIMDNEFVEYEITPINAEFENVPKPQILQYLFIEFEDSIIPSKVHIASFLCSGENPIGGDAFSDSLSKLSEDVKTPETSTSIFIASGIAAEDVSVSLERKARAKVYDRFLQLFEYRSGVTNIETDHSNIYVPNVLAGLPHLSTSSVDRKLYSAFFTRTNSSLNGCSEKFRKNMQHLLIENVAKTNPFNGIEISKKRFSSKYKLKWVL